MRLFVGGLATVELARLAVMDGETFCTDPAFGTGLAHRRATKSVSRMFARGLGCQRVWFIRHAANWLRHLHMAVALLIGEWALRRIDRDLMKLRRAQPR